MSLPAPMASSARPASPLPASPSLPSRRLRARYSLTGNAFVNGCVRACREAWCSTRAPTRRRRRLLGCMCRRGGSAGRGVLPWSRWVHLFPEMKRKRGGVWEEAPCCPCELYEQRGTERGGSSVSAGAWLGDVLVTKNQRGRDREQK